MTIAEIPQKIASASKDAAHELQERASSIHWDERPWTRTVAIGSLIAGAILLARGKRRAGAVASVAGAAIALLDHPQEVRTFWRNIPTYIESGKSVLERLEHFFEDLSRQGEKLRKLI